MSWKVGGVRPAGQSGRSCRRPRRPGDGVVHMNFVIAAQALLKVVIGLSLVVEQAQGLRPDSGVEDLAKGSCEPPNLDKVKIQGVVVLAGFRMG
jgi:hypothetical protein